ncbi:alpha/beta fold hydrolase [Mycolicibacterium fortuitum]|uniref:alpha/beta fold hydrolase n=1 Tax=Mycolicibacterium fortuitum TaxID=1766 RepID=UPI001F373828|nr:alpha/beta hydrolase [Mycolicibacterium fortuitum]
MRVLMERQFIEGPVGRLGVLYTGESAREPLVLLHPINAAAVVWSDVARRLDRSVVAIDVRGHGDSTANGPFTVEQGYVRDVLAVLDSLGHDRVHLCGGSLGGTISVALAALCPKRVLSVTTFGSTLGTGLTSEAIDAMVQELLEKGTVRYFADLVPQIVGAAHRRSARLQKLMAVAAGERKEAVVAQIMRGAFGADIRDLAGNLAGSGIPVHAVVGAEDPTCPPSMSQEIAAVTAGSLTVLDGVGHLPMLEVPTRVAEILETVPGASS